MSTTIVVEFWNNLVISLLIYDDLTIQPRTWLSRPTSAKESSW
ncbi:hypothetical protein TMEN_4865 [Trichophyton mentagrophytes]|nr:hypothetical protein TMEN_4865 [Trichophyton mentagrophytes]